MVSERRTSQNIQKETDQQTSNTEKTEENKNISKEVIKKYKLKDKSGGEI